MTFKLFLLLSVCLFISSLFSWLPSTCFDKSAPSKQSVNDGARVKAKKVKKT